MQKQGSVVLCCTHSISEQWKHLFLVFQSPCFRSSESYITYITTSFYLQGSLKDVVFYGQSNNDMWCLDSSGMRRIVCYHLCHRGQWYKGMVLTHSKQIPTFSYDCSYEIPYGILEVRVLSSRNIVLLSGDLSQGLSLWDRKCPFPWSLS